MKGLILKGIGGFYTVLDEDGNRHELRAQAKLRHNRVTPLIGDMVEFTPGQGEEEGWLEAILPRKNELVRPPVANIDALCVVLAAASPQPDPLLADKLLLYAERNGIECYVAVNKCDLDEETAQSLFEQYKHACSGVFKVSALKRRGIEELKRALSGKKHAFGGQSGVGKSTLINALYSLALQTGSVSDKTERGKHTTRRSELLLADGAMVFDTPGFSLMELPLMEPQKLPILYPELAPFEGKCRFAPCSHRSEPGCAAKRESDIHPLRYERYLSLYDEVDTMWRERYD